MLMNLNLFISEKNEAVKAISAKKLSKLLNDDFSRSIMLDSFENTNEP